MKALVNYGLVPRTVHMKCFEEQVAGTCPKNSFDQFEFMGLVAGTKVWSLQLHFPAKMGHWFVMFIHV